MTTSDAASAAGDGAAAEAPSLVLLPSSRARRAVVFAVVVLVAFGFRVYRITNPPYLFVDTRQYWSAIVARAFYLRSADSAPAWRREVAEATMANMRHAEMPIAEYMASLLYRISGRERVWLARTMCAVFWLLGALFLYAVCRRAASPDGALIGLLFYLFAPFGVSASRAFMHDPLMVMLILGGVWAVVRYWEAPCTGRLVVAAVLSALAVFIKPPVGAFFVFGAYVALAIVRRGVWRGVVSWPFVVFAVASLLPAVAYTAYGILSGRLARQLGLMGHLTTFGLLLTPGFWHGWLDMLARTVGYAAVPAALLGLIVVRQTAYRAMLIGLLAGYVLFGIVFHYGIYTHPYYSLVLVPIVALALPPVAELFLGWLRRPGRPRMVGAAVWVVLALAICLPAEPILWERSNPTYQRDARLRSEIGELVNHSTRTIFLDRVWGMMLRYYGEIDGEWWPDQQRIAFDEAHGAPVPTADERLDEMIEQYDPEFFIIGEMSFYRKQPGLRDVLSRRYAVLRETEHYIIFDMRERIDQGNAPSDQNDAE